MPIRLRHAAFLLHKWLGLALALPLAVLGLSGAVLVWPGALDRIVHPSRHAAGAATLPVGRYAEAAARRLRPGERVLRLSVGKGVRVELARDREATATLYLDGVTAQVRTRAAAADDASDGVRRWHGGLIAGDAGRMAVAGLGLAVLLLGATGVALWWPAGGGWRTALRWRRRPEATARAHFLVGFWTAAPLAVLATTGVLLGRPALLPESPSRPEPPAARPTATTRLSPDIAVARAVDALDGAVSAADVRTLTWPTERRPDWLVEVKSGGDPLITVAVADDGSVAVPLAAAPGEPAGAAWLRRWHGGGDAGLAWRVAASLLGLVLAGLSVTGAWMAWRGRRRRLPDDQRR